ncbi:hypothetical protein H6S82_05230 [Planktothrix sp. FACHB-1355]|uniref:Uncharacterized protein n=1 Tax=Aerosakkonema funiforme FACHB-1375 TaxID=2949571 RepID=A0A926VDK4_9CYAN|nr:hypothetical protein [Aerosakkonema funiforme FACHB-1375]MBD3558258.1 hypothetical protein [Planktothrix sp. FACHB-1355]
MSKLLSAVLVVTGVFLNYAEHPQLTLAGTCASKCPPPPLGFIPGQRVNIQVVNRTSSIVLLEKVQDTDAFPLRPGQEVRFQRWTGTEPNLSVVFWDATGLSLVTRLSKPDEDTLRIELRPGGRPPGDRSIYILNDGRVTVF